jgi:hypothetical protein
MSVPFAPERRLTAEGVAAEWDVFVRRVGPSNLKKMPPQETLRDAFTPCALHLLARVCAQRDGNASALEEPRRTGRKSKLVRAGSTWRWLRTCWVSCGAETITCHDLMRRPFVRELVPCTSAELDAHVCTSWAALRSAEAIVVSDDSAARSDDAVAGSAEEAVAVAETIEDVLLGHREPLRPLKPGEVAPGLLGVAPDYCGHLECTGELYCFCPMCGCAVCRAHMYIDDECCVHCEHRQLAKK